VQQNDNVNNAKQALINTIQNEASAKVEGIMGPILMIVLVIAVAIGAGTYGGEKLLMSPVFMSSIFAIVLIYGGVAWLKKWFPFNNKDEDKYGPPMNIIPNYPPDKVVPVKLRV
jgi:anaerobic C4-dicarboxylate transporter